MPGKTMDAKADGKSGGGKDDKKKKALLADFGKSLDGMDKQVDALQKLVSQAGKGMDDKMGKQITGAVASLQKMLDKVSKHSESLDDD